MKTVKDICDMIYGYSVTRFFDIDYFGTLFCCANCDICYYKTPCDMCEIADNMILEGLY